MLGFLAAITLGIDTLSAQNTLNTNLEISLLKDTVIQNGTIHSFNRVRIINRSPSKQIFGLEVNVPSGWNSLFENRAAYSIEPNQVLDLPVRVAAPNSALSNQLYVISLILSDGGIGGKTAYSYVAKVQGNSRWRASLPSQNLKIDRINRETYFQISLSNSGNIDQTFILNFNTPLELTLPKRNTKVRVKAGSDTLVQVGIITEAKYLTAFKPQDIIIDISNEENENYMLVQKVYSNNTLFRENPSRWYTAPVSIELVSQNFNIKSQKIYYINSSGTLDLSKNRSLSFNYRTNDFYSESNNSTRFANLDYTTKHWNISLGDQREFSSFIIDGLGMRLERRSDNGYRFAALGVRSRLGNARQFSIEQEFPSKSDAIIINRTLANLDIDKGINSYSNVLEYSKTFKKSGTLSLSGGYGLEDIKNSFLSARTQGQAAGVRYDYNSPAFIIRTANNLTTRNFPGLERGVRRSSNEFRFKMKQFFTGAIAEFNDRSVSTLDSSQFIYLFGGRTSEYGFRTGLIKNRTNITLTASVVDQLQDSLNNAPFRSNKLNLNTAFGLTKQLSLSFSGNLAKSFSTIDSMKSVYALNAFGSLQAKGMGLSFRYDNGPLYYSEILAYQLSGLKNNRFQISPYLETNFFKSALNTRVELNYAREVATKEKSLVVRLDLGLDLNKRGLSLRFYGSHEFYNTQGMNALNLSIRKNLSMPVFGFQKYQSLKVTLFKDNNNSGVFDLYDEVIPDANIKIGNQYFTTNKNGQATYKNLSPGTYPIDLGQISNIKGWIAKNGFKPSVTVTKSQDLYIPFQQSRVLSGKLNLLKDPLSKKIFDPSNIRITAINSNGESFTTLSNQEGNFFLNLAEGNYIVQINSNVFSEDFRILQPSFEVDLKNKEEAFVTFEIRERKREINIRRTNQD